MQSGKDDVIKDELHTMKMIVKLVKKGNDVAITRAKDGSLKASIVRKKKIVG